MTHDQARQLYVNADLKPPADLEAPAERYEKYGRQRKEIDGIKFDSTLEATAYQLLKAWEAAGAISALELQPEFTLQDGFRDKAGKWHRAIVYRADFAYRPVIAHVLDMPVCSMIPVVIDTKGVRTPAFQIKEKLFRARFPDIPLEVWDKKKLKELSRA